MTYLDSQIELFLPNFFGVWPFQHLPSDLQESVAAKLQLCSFSPGEIIYTPQELPSAVHCILAGKVRLLASPSQQSLTLAVLGKGSVIGWDSLLRRITAGTIRAALSTPPDNLGVLTLTLPAEEFETLMIDHLMPVLMRQISDSELFDVLFRYLSQTAAQWPEFSIRELVQHIQRQQLAIVRNWFPRFARNFAQPHTPAQLISNRVWLISGGAPLNLSIGSVITDFSQLQQLQPCSLPTRLIGIDRNFFMSAILNQTITSEVNSGLSTDSDRPLQNLFPAGMVLSNRIYSSRFRADNNYPIQRSASDPVADFVTCFSTIRQFLQMPYCSTSLRYWLSL
jgi:ATP-binding cassette subfamily B protein